MRTMSSMVKKVIYGRKACIDCKIVRGPALRRDVIYGEKVIYERACVPAPPPCPRRPSRTALPLLHSPNPRVPKRSSMGKRSSMEKGHLWARLRIRHPHAGQGNSGCGVVRGEKIAPRPRRICVNYLVFPMPCAKDRGPVLWITAARPQPCDTAISRF
jgi:hypothetical protein